jgi:hypothetical protein
VIGLAAFIAAAMSVGGTPPNFVPNGSFERSLAGWGASNARLVQVRGGVVGAHAARALAHKGVTSFSINPAKKPVRSTQAATSYYASAWVRSARIGGRLCLRIREWNGGDVAASTQVCATVGKGWHHFAGLGYTPVAAGRQLDVYAYRYRAVAGDSFELDGVSLTARATPPPTGETADLIAAGDIGACDSDGDEQTAKLVEGLPGTVATLGDNAYENGGDNAFQHCYEPTWGRFKSRTRPSPGNHEYWTKEGAGYFRYFGTAAGPGTRGYYSYDLGAWHLISLNSNCDVIDCDPQVRWLRADLAANRTRCTLAYWHHPRFSSGLHGADRMTAPFWNELYEAGADVILNGHDHDYERFLPQNPEGRPDQARGIREFVAGTGGRGLYYFGPNREPTSQVRNRTTFGVLTLRLRPDGYDWRFAPVPGGTFSDAGSDTCH